MSDLKKYSGVIPAFYACYDDQGTVSPQRVQELTRYLIEKGVNGLYVGGSSGECIYQSVDERKTVLENVMMGGQKDVSHNMLRFIVDLRGSHREERVLREKACEVLDSIGMYHLRNETVDNLAYGRQKVCELGRALMTTPQLILLDEPAAGLDPEGREMILSQVKRFHKETGTTVILVSHSMEDIAKYADKVLVMDQRRIAMYDTVEHVFARADELLELGLSVPQVTKVFLRLRAMGLDLPQDVYTVPYAVKTIQAALAKKNGGGEATG